MTSNLLAAVVDVIEAVAPAVFAIAAILGVAAVIVWVFERWNRERP